MIKELSHDYFAFWLKQDRYRNYRRKTAFIFLFNAVAFLYLASRAISVFQNVMLIFIAGMLLIFAAYCFLSTSYRKKDYVILYLLPAAIWTIEFGFWPITVIMIFLLVFQIIMESRTSVVVSLKGIEIKGVKTRNIEWTELDNVVMKDGLLTIDFTNNKIFQAEPAFADAVSVHSTISGSHDNIDWVVGEDYLQMEHSFNTFVKQQLQHIKA